MQLEIEQAVLGGLMGLKQRETDLANYAFSRLKPSFFNYNAHIEIFKAIRVIASQDKMFDSLSVTVAVKDNPLVEIFDVDRCYQYRADPSTLRQHIESLRDASIEKYAINKMTDIIDQVSNKDKGNIRERLGLAESAINNMLNQITEGSQTGLRDGFHWSNEWFDNLEAHHGGSVENFTLGFDCLDEILQPKGIRPGSLVVVGARPKMGKTFFATRVAEHYVSERDQAACVFSMEMGGADIYERILSGFTKTNSNQFYTVDMQNNSFWDHIGGLNNDLANKKLLIDDTAGVSINHIKSEVRKAHRKSKVGVVIVDYLTLMGGNENAERNDLKYGEITKQLKILAKELGCMILMLTQLNRGLENRNDKRPMPSDGRDTGQIEQDCDVWIGLYRERVYDKDCPYNHTEAIIRLNRAGDGGTGYLTLNNGYFEALDSNSVIMEMEKIESDKIKKKEEENAQSKKYARRN